ncbi:Response regulator MprA [Calidithermus terrae]|uniref:Response regulator MprA n=1 Tax=Calidithermus terrae TaxID=1408545 RepID=A0A399ENF8_9DEIN|nr:response regulator [Calidithermus terrae]RIH85528.1 Response regulator MprA [Calidithermus terrae]
MALILVVDDEASIRSFLRRTLSLYGHEVMVGETGLQAVEITAERCPDLMILDYNLPGLDGLEVLEAVARRCPSHKVLMLTGREDHEVEDRAVALGVGAFVQKPIDLNRLIALVDALLESP